MEDKQRNWRERILSFMERWPDTIDKMLSRYFYLICFSTYAKEFGPGGFEKSFVSVSRVTTDVNINHLDQWMDERPKLREMIQDGKDRLEWYRWGVSW